MATKYEILEGEIKLGDHFIAFGVIGKCTEVDNSNIDESNYNSKETKWTSGTDCKKIKYNENK